MLSFLPVGKYLLNRHTLSTISFDFQYLNVTCSNLDPIKGPAFYMSLLTKVSICL